MPDKKTVAFSAYEWRARLTPGLFGIAPIAITVVALGLKANPVVSIGLGILSATGGGYLLSVVVGNAGRRAQPGLYRQWNGRPTTQLLRTRDAADNPTQRDIWRKAIEAVTGVGLLSKRREAANPAEADHAIEAATDQVRYLGQDPRFPLVASENAAYGFERNIWGFRWAGRGVALICLTAISLILLLGKHTSFHISVGAATASVAINTLFLLVWCILPSKRRAREAGFRYAQQLLNAVVQVNRAASATTTTSQPTTSETPEGA